MPATRERKLIRSLRCPHCWQEFPPFDVHWIAEHPELYGDPILGETEKLRFLPMRFTVEGNALDPRGAPCTRLACPHCHLPLPEDLLESRPRILSILGAPASGKSFLLAAGISQLREILPSLFRVSFVDADPELNTHIHEYERSLLECSGSPLPVPLARLIRKTEEHGDLYHTINVDGKSVTYPRPALFTLAPLPGHPRFTDDPDAAARMRRVLCLYDNAGESFLPGKDRDDNAVTRHLAIARVLIFLFDPLQASAFVDAIRRTPHPRLGRLQLKPQPSQQSLILTEAASRIRRHSGAAGTPSLSDRLVIVAVTKYDLWYHLLGEDQLTDPWVLAQTKHGEESGQKIAALNMQQIETVSSRVRKLTQSFAPDLIATLESQVREVLFVPVSAVGAHTQLGDHGQFVIPGNRIRPVWACVPILLGLTRVMSKLIPATAVRTR